HLLTVHFRPQAKCEKLRLRVGDIHDQRHDAAPIRRHDPVCAQSSLADRQVAGRAREDEHRDLACFGLPTATGRDADRDACDRFFSEERPDPAVTRPGWLRLAEALELIHPRAASEASGYPLVGLACVLQLASGLTAAPLALGVSDWVMVLPFISHSAIAPESLRQRMSALLSPLKSPISTTCQLASGVTAAPPEVVMPEPAATVVPSINQVATLPLPLRQRMSALPS